MAVDPSPGSTHQQFLSLSCFKEGRFDRVSDDTDGPWPIGFRPKTIAHMLVNSSVTNLMLVSIRSLQASNGLARMIKTQTDQMIEGNNQFLEKIKFSGRRS
jgi:hypothetical protein